MAHRLFIGADMVDIFINAIGGVRRGDGIVYRQRLSASTDEM